MTGARRAGPAMVLASALVVLAGCSSAHHDGAPTGPSVTTIRPKLSLPTVSRPTVSRPTAPQPTVRQLTIDVFHPCYAAAPRTYTHVVWILMENRGADQVEGSSSAPYLDRLGGQCAVATNYSGVSHPSLPNYIALTSGGTQGVSDDADPARHRLSGPSIFSLLGSGWRSLEESMPASCALTGSGGYAVRHNPAAYYTNIRRACAAQDVALPSPPDVSARFTFITPNLCDDMHDCSTQAGDTWLSREVPQIVSTPQYQSGSTVVFITFDENDDGGALVPLYVVAPSVAPRTRVGQAFDHYSLLRTTQELLGLQPYLGRAATAPSMTSAFGL